MLKKIPVSGFHLGDERLSVAISNGFARESFDAVCFTKRSNGYDRYLQSLYERKSKRVIKARLPISPSHFWEQDSNLHFLTET
jgi:hypothetical protein